MRPALWPASGRWSISQACYRALILPPRSTALLPLPAVSSSGFQRVHGQPSKIEVMRPLRPLGAIGSTRTRICLCSWIDAAAPPTRVKWYFSVKVTSAAPLPPPCHLRLASTPPAPTCPDPVGNPSLCSGRLPRRARLPAATGGICCSSGHGFNRAINSVNQRGFSRWGYSRDPPAPLCRGRASARLFFLVIPTGAEGSWLDLSAGTVDGIISPFPQVSPRTERGICFLLRW